MGRGKNTKYDEKTGKVTLVIDDLGPGDEGQYECRADNPYGDSTCTIMVSRFSQGFSIFWSIRLAFGCSRLNQP